MTDATRRLGPGRPASVPADTLFDPNAEPRLDDMLADPVVRLVMRRDRLDPRDVRAFMEATAEKLRDGRAGPAFVAPPVANNLAGCVACR
jgi:hypothetical protein